MENSLKEIKVLIEYMIKHTQAHNKELMELAEKIKPLNNDAYDEIIKAYNNFILGNEKLQKSLELLNK